MRASSGLHYQTLDHWRGFAALAVVCFHAFFPWIDRPVPAGLQWLAALAGQGWKGVHFFFVISGYCIALLALREIRRQQTDARFLVSRCLRIFPPYWAACAVAALIALAALPFNHGAIFSTTAAKGALPGSASSFVSHAFLLDPLFDREGYLLVSWTLSWEVSFYLFTAVLIWIGASLNPRIAVTLALLVALIGSGLMGYRPWPVLGGWSEFSCGGCLLLALEARNENRPSWPWLVAIGTLGAIGGRWGGMGSTLLLAAAFALALYGVHRHDQALANGRFLRWAGRLGLMSYSIYLLHAPIVSASRNLLSRVVPPCSAWFIVPIIFSIALALVGSWAFYRWVEVPLERWRKTLRWLHRSSPVSNSHFPV